MHGFIHTTLRSLVIAKGGEEKWRNVLLAVRDSITEMELLSLVMHPDELTVRAVVAAAETLGVTVAEALLAFGAHFVTFMDETGYLETVRAFGSDVLEFVHNLNQMHAHLRRMEVHRDCRFPHFLIAGGRADADPDEGLRFSYSSSRGDMLAPVVEGIIPALAERVYGQCVTLTRLPPVDGYHATWRLVVEKSDEEEAKLKLASFATSATRTSRTDAERRAASKWHDAMVGGGKGPSMRVHPLSTSGRAARVHQTLAALPPAAAAAHSDAEASRAKAPLPNGLCAGNVGACAAFTDAEHEASFRAAVLLPRLLRRAFPLTAAVAIVSAALLGSVLARPPQPATEGTRGAHVVATLIGLIASALTSGALLLARCAPERCGATAVEAAVCVWLAAVSVAVTVLLGARDDDACDGGRDGGEQLALLCGGALVLLSSLAVPLEPLGLTVNGAVAIAAVVARLVGTCPVPAAESVATAVVVLALLVAAVLNSVERAQTTRLYFGRDNALFDMGLELRRKHKLADYLKAHRTEIAIAARSKLIRVVMHDLRSPLLAASNIGEALASSPESKLGEPKILELVGGLQTCVSTMEHIMGDMLDFERIDSGQLVLVQSPFALETLLRDARTLFASQADAKGIAFEIEPAPAELCGLDLVGDMPRLLQCLSNGLSNALKFTDEGGTVRIEVTSTRHSREGWLRVHLTVSDDGVGLSRSELEQLRMGGVFLQVGRGQLQGRGGTGLGLNIARSILQLHSNSELLLHSAGEGRGTSFELQLNLPKLGFEDQPTSTIGTPAHNSKASMVGRARTATSLRKAEHGPAQCHLRETADGARALEESIVDGRPTPSAIAVLHVEDDHLLQLTIGARIAKEGIEVEIANNGEEALARVRRRVAECLPPFSLILMDNQMPLMGGSACTSILRRDGFKGLICGMTGDPFGSEDRMLFEAAGLDECVDKTPAGLDSIICILRLQKEKVATAAAAAAVAVAAATRQASRVSVRSVPSDMVVVDCE